MAATWAGRMRSSAPSPSKTRSIRGVSSAPGPPCAVMEPTFGRRLRSPLAAQGGDRARSSCSGAFSHPVSRLNAPRDSPSGWVPWGACEWVSSWGQGASLALPGSSGRSTRSSPRPAGGPSTRERIVGTSAGAVVGALAASGIPPEYMGAYAAGRALDGLRRGRGARRRPVGERCPARTTACSCALPPIGPGSWRLALNTMRHLRSHAPAVVLAGWLPRGFISTGPIQRPGRRLRARSLARPPELLGGRRRLQLGQARRLRPRRRSAGVARATRSPPRARSPASTTRSRSPAGATSTAGSARPRTSTCSAAPTSTSSSA